MERLPWQTKQNLSLWVSGSDDASKKCQRTSNINKRIASNPGKIITSVQTLEDKRGNRVAKGRAAENSII